MDDPNLMYSSWPAASACKLCFSIILIQYVRLYANDLQLTSERRVWIPVAGTRYIQYT